MIVQVIHTGSAFRDGSFCNPFKNSQGKLKIKLYAGQSAEHFSLIYFNPHHQLEAECGSFLVSRPLISSL